MSCGSVGNIKIEPVDISWAIEEQWHITCTADDTSSLNNKYFIIRDFDDNKHHVWLNVNSAGADPAPANSTGHEIAVPEDASAATIAAAIATTIGGAYASKKIQDITYTAVNAGVGGNSITIDYNDTVSAGSEAVTVVGNAITVAMDDGNSTAAQILTAFNASAPALLLVTPVVDSGDEGDVQAAFGSALPLLGGANASDDFVADADGAEVTITTVGAADVTDYADVDTGFSFTQCQQGGDLDLGFTDGDLEVTFEETLLSVTAHQTGVTPLADLRQGLVADVKLTMKECNAAKLEEIFAKAAGGSYTPAGGTKLFGWGTSKQGSSTIVQARRLVLHPVRLADNVYTNDLCFWKAYPLPDSLVFSGENPQTVKLTFKIYLDESQQEEISQWAYGDYTQLIP